MKFYQAIQKLKEGFKIRRSCWDKGHYWVLSKDNLPHRILVNSIGKVPEMNKNQMEADDWELFRNELCLFDKIVNAEDVSPKAKVLFLSDVEDLILGLEETIKDISYRKSELISRHGILYEINKRVRGREI